MELQHLQPESLDQLANDAVTRVRRVIDRIANATATVDDLLDIQLLLNALPMGTDEFGLAKNRLSNACHYLRSNTSGAALYELKLLLGSLHSSFHRVRRQPSRRLKFNRS